jgi:hypothetical protein
VKQSDFCGICGRELGDANIQQHHLITKQYKGKITALIHKVCDQKIHATFSEKQLYQYYHTFDRLLEDPDIQCFVKWIAKKLPEYYSKNADTAARKRIR